MTPDADLRLIRATERSTDTQQTSGMTREVAISKEGIWAAFVRTEPGMASGWHHHAAYETAIFLLKGRVRFEFGRGGANAIEAGPGDFVHVPPGAVHRESDPEATEGQIVVIRAGTGAPNVNVDGPA
ncbi:MAG: cupin domain-containing protein [Chloroflexi bacterium]|nr:cupin domain-containing protein [Chloroflexota bacterium]